MSDDGSAVVNVLGCERSELGFESRRPESDFTSTHKKKKKKKNGGKISSTPAATSTAPSDNYSGLGANTTIITHNTATSNWWLRRDYSTPITLITSLCKSVGAGKPTFPKPGRTGGRSTPLCESSMYTPGKVAGRISLSTWPWVVAHPRSWCQGLDRRDKFPATLYFKAPVYESPIRNCRARLADRRPVVAWPYIHSND